MSLTICYLTKNSILNLPESYFVMRNLSKDIVVIDTGSTDGTFEWAQSISAIQCYKFNWSNSFSKARNFGISKCTGDYILMIDDDEFIPSNYHKDILQYINTDKNFIFTFDVLNYLEDPRWIVKPLMLQGRAARLFANKDIFYEKHVHEILKSKIHIRVDLKIPIFHFQYKSRINIENKMKYYRELIHMDIKEFGSTTFIDNIHLANTYRESYRWTGKCEYAEQAIKFLKDADAMQKQPYITEEIKLLEEALNVKIEEKRSEN